MQHQFNISVLPCPLTNCHFGRLGKMYRGILPPILVEAPKRAIKFAANEQYTALFRKYQIGTSNGLQPFLCGMAAGMTEAVAIVPFELVKIRMQDKHSVPKKAINRATPH